MGADSTGADVLPFTFLGYHLTTITLSWLIGFLPRFAKTFGVLPERLGRDWNALQCLGAALIAYPFVRFLIGIYESIPLLQEYTVLEAIPEAALWRTISNQVIYFTLVPLLGVILVSRMGRRARALEPGTAHPLVDALKDAGSAPRVGLREDVSAGLSLLILVLLLYLGGTFILYTFLGSVLVTGDESRVFLNVTPPILLGLSIMAGVSEEFLFRGVLMTMLRARFGLIAAVIGQAVFFGFVHAGYGNWAHVVGPAIFGLMMTVVAMRYGLAAAIVIHAGIDVFFFSLSLLELEPAYIVLAAAVAVAALIVGIATRFEAAIELARWLFGEKDGSKTAT
ncbi:MAG: CPBP family intramembrane metalloprotease [Euryarchaeota archaeon]|nr:CPBP family intramembrane metalloprotease [Euryarchaeota archaeon]